MLYRHELYDCSQVKTPWHAVVFGTDEKIEEIIKKEEKTRRRKFNESFRCLHKFTPTGETVSLKEFVAVLSRAEFVDKKNNERAIEVFVPKGTKQLAEIRTICARKGAQITLV